MYGGGYGCIERKKTILSRETIAAEELMKRIEEYKSKTIEVELRPIP